MLNDYNLTMLTDFYEITMANGYFNSDIKDAEACFDVFFRRVPDGGGFAIMAGLEQIIAYMKRLSFTEEDTDYLRSKNCFSEEFLQFLLISNSHVTYGQYLKATRYSRTSLS